MIGADSLGYMEIDKLKDMVGDLGYCDACFTGITRCAFREKIFPTRLSQKNREDKTMGYDKYVSPLSERYASKEMQYIFLRTEI